MKVAVTGGIGLIGTACCELLLKNGYEVISIDNNLRKKFLGYEANNIKNIKSNDFFKDVEMVNADIRDKKIMSKIIKKVDAVIHCAAQTSHPKSLEIPLEDFSINAWGTLQLLELVRQLNPTIPFAFMSSNKVFGDYPNYFDYKIIR